MNRELRIRRRADDILASNPHPDSQLAAMLYCTAMAQAEDEIGPPPYKPYGWNRVNLNIHAVKDGVPIEDL